jgi:hypothetical protein
MVQPPIMQLRAAVQARFWPGSVDWIDQWARRVRCFSQAVKLGHGTRDVSQQTCEHRHSPRVSGWICN